MRIYVLPLSFPDKNLFNTLCNTLEDTFKISVVILNHPLPLEKGKDPIRNQYNSTWILSQLLKEVLKNPVKL